MFYEIIRISYYCIQGGQKTWKPGKTWNLRNFEKKKKTGKTWNFEQKSLKNLEKPVVLTIFTCLIVKFQFGTKSLL